MVIGNLRLGGLVPLTLVLALLALLVMSVLAVSQGGAAQMDTTADRVFGQDGDFSSDGINVGGVSSGSLNYANDVAVDSSGNLYVADLANNRVLEYDSPLTTDQIADRVFGQGDDFTSNDSNHGGLSARSLRSPWGVALDSAGNVYIVDIGNIIIPAAIILVGLLVIFGRGLGSRTEVGDRINSFNVFSGSEIASHSKQFEGGSISAVFGGAEVDLRDAVPAPGAVLDVFTAFGGVEVTVPQGWHVATRGLPLFGGIENATAKDHIPADAPTLAVNATVLFGGLEIKH